MMKPVNQKLIASKFSRFMGYAMLSLPLTLAAKCGSLIETMDCIAQKYELKRPCKVIDTKLISTSPTQGQTNIPINTNRIYFYLENGNEDGYDPNQFTATLQVGNRPAINIPSSALEKSVEPGATKLGNTTVGIRIDNSIYNQTDPNNPLNLAFGDNVTVNISSGSVSFSVNFTVVENPAGLADIDNDNTLVEVPNVNQIVLRNVFNGYVQRTLNLTSALPGNDYVFSQIEGNKLFLVRDIGTNARSAAGDSVSTSGHQVIEIDLLTGNVTMTTVPSQNVPLFNEMESIINAHQGPTTTVTTANPPADWRIYPVIRRNNIVDGADADLVVRMYYNGGEYQEITVTNAFPLFGGAFPALSVRLSNNTFVLIAEPGRMIRLTFDYNAAAAWGSKVTVTPNFLTIPLTIAGALPGELVLAHDIFENKNIPGEFFVFYSDINTNRFVQRYDNAGNFLGRIQVPNSVVKVISFTSQTVENAMGLVHNGTNQIQVMSGQNFGLGTLGASVSSNNASASQLAVFPQVPGLLNESAAQTMDAGTEIYNKSQAGVSVVNLTTQRIEKRTLNNTLSSTVDISGLITTLKTNLGTTNDPNDAKVIEQGNNYILILKINDGVRERVAVLDLAASAATWISPAGSDCEMVYGAGKYNDGGTDRLLVLYHLAGSPNFVIDNGVTNYTNALGGFSINTMTILDPAYTNGLPTQMRVAVAKTNGLQLLTFNKSNLSVPASNTTILNNLIAAVGADTNIGSVVSLQASAASDDDLASSSFYALVEVLKAGVLKQMILTVNTTGAVSAGWLEWNWSAKNIRGLKRLSDGRFLVVDTLGRTYLMQPSGATYRTFHSNMLRGNIFR